MFQGVRQASPTSKIWRRGCLAVSPLCGSRPYTQTEYLDLSRYILGIRSDRDFPPQGTKWSVKALRVCEYHIPVKCSRDPGEKFIAGSIGR